jgi:tetratricopeptide (TPR) repeat protein
MKLSLLVRISRSSLLFGLMAAVLAAGGILACVYTTRADYLLGQGQAALAQGDWDKAERYAERLEQRGHSNWSHLLRGEAWVRLGRATREHSVPAGLLLSGLGTQGTRPLEAFRLALGELSRIRDDGPVGQQGTVLAAECLVYLGEQRLAAEALTPLVKQQPEVTEAHRWLAAIYIDLNSANEAIEHLEAWGRLDPTTGRPYRWIGLFHKDYKRPAEAIAAYREASRRRLDPALQAAVVKELAETLIETQGAYQEALDALAQCPEGFAGPEILTLRAECLWSLGRHDEGIELVESALRESPDLIEALLLRAKIALADDQPQAALPPLEKVVALDPHNVRSRQYLMQTYKQVGDRTRAAQQQRLLEETKGYMDRLTKLHQEAKARPWDDRIRHQIAVLCLKVNRVAEARTWLRAALASNPDNQQARQTLAELGERGNSPARRFSPSIE